MKQAEYAAMYDGLVVNNNDPSKMNRLQIRVPQFHGTKDKGKIISATLGIEDDDLPWAPICNWFPTMSFLPELGASVYVQFLNGNLDRPIVVGYPTRGATTLPSDASGNYINSKVIKTNNFTIHINDSENICHIYGGSTHIKIKADSDVVEINGNTYKAVQGEDIKSVLDSLVLAFNSHIHGTGVGPSTTPTTPFSDSTNYLSDKVKLG